MELVLDITKNVNENAAIYFEKAKKLKKKTQGAMLALNESLKKLNQLEKEIEAEAADALLLEEYKEKLKDKKKEWYEKFRWFISSEGFLVIGGRDATSNEVIIKKHTETNDLVFHTDITGSPFFVVKSENKQIGDKTKEEVANATCTFSKAWKLGLYTTPVFYIKPEQISRKTKSGEYLTKGGFMIYGKTTYIDNTIDLAVGITKKNQIMAGPLESIKKNCDKIIVLEQGSEKASSIAKYIKHNFGGSIDDIIRVLPSGKFRIKNI